MYTIKGGDSYVWLVEPRGAQTNRIISEMEGVSEEGSVYCADGKYHNLWRMSGHAMVTALKHSRDKLNLEFSVFRKRNNEYPICVDAWMIGKRKTVKPRAMAN